MQTKILISALSVLILLLCSCGGKNKQNEDKNTTTIKITTNIDAPKAKIADAIVTDAREKENSDEDRVYYLNDLREVKETAALKDAINYFRENNKYKDWDSSDRREVIIKAIIEKDGTASNVIVQKSSGNGDLDNEAIRLIKDATYLIATNLSGKPIRIDYTNIVYFPPK